MASSLHSESQSAHENALVDPQGQVQTSWSKFKVKSQSQPQVQLRGLNPTVNLRISMGTLGLMFYTTLTYLEGVRRELSGYAVNALTRPLQLPRYIKQEMTAAIIYLITHPRCQNRPRNRRGPKLDNF